MRNAKPIKLLTRLVCSLFIAVLLSSCNGGGSSESSGSEFVIGGTVVKIMNLLIPGAYAKDTTALINGCSLCTDPTACASLYVVDNNFDRTLVCQTSIDSSGAFEFRFPSQPAELVDAITEIEAVKDNLSRKISTVIVDTSQPNLLLNATEVRKTLGATTALVQSRIQNTSVWQHKVNADFQDLIANIKSNYSPSDFFYALNQLKVINQTHQQQGTTEEEFFDSANYSHTGARYCLSKISEALNEYLSNQSINLNQITQMDSGGFATLLYNKGSDYRFCNSLVSRIFEPNASDLPANSAPLFTVDSYSTANGTPMTISVAFFDLDGDAITSVTVGNLSGQAIASSSIISSQTATFEITPVASNTQIFVPVTVADSLGNQTTSSFSLNIGTVAPPGGK